MLPKGYPYIQKRKITLEKLLSCKLKPIPTSSIINGLVIDLIRVNKVKYLQWKVIFWLKQLYGHKWPNNSPADLTIIKTLITPFRKHRNLTVQCKQDEHTNYMNTLFQLPSTKLLTNRRIRKKPRQRSALRKEELKAYNTALKDMGSALKSAGAEANHLHKKIKSFHQKFKNFQKRNKRKEITLHFKRKW